MNRDQDGESPRGQEIARDRQLHNGRPQDQGDLIETFYRSGAFSRFFNNGDIEDGVQLIAYQYVPAGRTGFIKQIQAVPYLPAALAAAAGGGWAFSAGFPPVSIVDPINGFWKTPAGWKAIVYNTNPPMDGITAVWKWSLRLVDGNIENIRIPINAGFGLPANFQFWGNAPYPFPRALYAAGLPGRLISDVPTQEVQRFGDEGELHIVVPENTTICLFAEWSQQAIAAQMFSLKDDDVYPGETWVVYPLLPSFGYLVGYMQSNTSEATRSAARNKW